MLNQKLQCFEVISVAVMAIYRQPNFFTFFICSSKRCTWWPRLFIFNKCIFTYYMEKCNGVKVQDISGQTSECEAVKKHKHSSVLHLSRTLILKCFCILWASHCDQRSQTQRCLISTVQMDTEFSRGQNSTGRSNTNGWAPAGSSAGSWQPTVNTFSPYYRLRILVKAWELYDKFFLTKELRAIKTSQFYQWSIGHPWFLFFFIHSWQNIWRQKNTKCKLL